MVEPSLVKWGRPPPSDLLNWTELLSPVRDPSIWNRRRGGGGVEKLGRRVSDSYLGRSSSHSYLDVSVSCPGVVLVPLPSCLLLWSSVPSVETGTSYTVLVSREHRGERRTLVYVFRLLVSLFKTVNRKDLILVSCLPPLSETVHRGSGAQYQDPIPE